MDDIPDGGAGSGRDSASPLFSAQVELFRNGDFITRSNAVECVYRRDIEPNPISPVNPPDPDDPTKPTHPYGPVQDLSVVEDEDAYCWVDIWSVGDDEGSPLLLGAPLFGASRAGHGFTMHVVPNWLAGDFVWTNCCCSISGSGYYFSYNCAGDCLCGGCSATGYYYYEGYRRPAWGGGCGCSSPSEPHDPHEGPDDPPVPVGVFASFSKRVIFLENEYANTKNEVDEFGQWVKRMPSGGITQSSGIVNTNGGAQ